MSVFFEEQTFWLNVTNLGLGLLALVSIIIVGVSVVQELLARWHARTVPGFSFDDHTFAIPSLGTTMADGGEPVEKPKTEG
jgi:hypothetical protein